MRELVEVATEVGASLVCESSLKVALDRAWDQQMEKDEALTLVLNVLRAVETLQQEDALLAQPSPPNLLWIKSEQFRTDYSLVFGTHSWKSMEAMKDIFWQMDPTCGSTYSAPPLLDGYTNKMRAKSFI